MGEAIGRPGGSDTGSQPAACNDGTQDSSTAARSVMIATLDIGSSRD
jgi:hypothetical protein